MAAKDNVGEVGNCQMKNRLEETPTKKKKLLHVGVYFIALMLDFLSLMICRSRSRRGRNIGSQVLANNSAPPRLNRFPS